MAYLKSHTDLPVAVGFEIKTPEMAATISRNADATVVGSAIVDRVLDGLDERRAGSGTAQMCSISFASADGVSGK